MTKQELVAIKDAMVNAVRTTKPCKEMVLHAGMMMEMYRQDSASDTSKEFASRLPSESELDALVNEDFACQVLSKRLAHFGVSLTKWDKFFLLSLISIQCMAEDINMSPGLLVVWAVAVADKYHQIGKSLDFMVLAATTLVDAAAFEKAYDLQKVRGANLMDSFDACIFEREAS